MIDIEKRVTEISGRSKFLGDGHFDFRPHIIYTPANGVFHGDMIDVLLHSVCTWPVRALVLNIAQGSGPK